jgi:hypothetical protein
MNKFDQMVELIKFYVNNSHNTNTIETLNKILIASKDIVTKRRHGVYEKGNYQGSKYGENCPEKVYWSHMIQRANPGVVWKIRPHYEGCSCTDTFNNFQTFAEWCQKQIGFGNKGWCLDKDLLVKGNKIYGEDTCVFLPQALNTLFSKRQNKRGEYPIGVCKRKNSNKFIAQCQDGEGKLKTLYGFLDEISAFLAYKEMKESVIKKLAEKWRDKIDPRAYEALMNYEVEITD